MLVKEATMADRYTFKYFNVSFPRIYVAHVEINRPDKLNAFIRPLAYPSSALVPLFHNMC